MIPIGEFECESFGLYAWYQYELEGVHQTLNVGFLFGSKWASRFWKPHPIGQHMFGTNPFSMGMFLMLVNPLQVLLLEDLSGSSILYQKDFVRESSVHHFAPWHFRVSNVDKANDDIEERREWLRYLFDKALEITDSEVDEMILKCLFNHENPVVTHGVNILRDQIKSQSKRVQYLESRIMEMKGRI